MGRKGPNTLMLVAVALGLLIFLIWKTSVRISVHSISTSPSSVYSSKTHIILDQLKVPNSLPTLPHGMDQTVAKWVSSWQTSIQEEFKLLCDSGVKMEDNKLLDNIKKVVLPPSPHPKVKFSRFAMKTPQIQEVLHILGDKRNGVFVEAGALDGERSSNTLYLETEKKWTGLLVEADPFFFLQVLGRSRNAYSINACLSPKRSPSMFSFYEDAGGRGRLNMGKGETQMQIPCYPLFSILKAINMTKIDYFSLDIEGVELPILQTIPFDKLDISMLSVEYGHGNKEQLKTFMESQGYVVHKDIHSADIPQVLYVEDFIFVKKEIYDEVKRRPKV